MSDDYERVQVESRDELRAWLLDNHARSSGIWLISFKKAADPDRHIGYDAIVEEVLCVGWIDSVQHRVDAARSELLLTPRKPGSNWSRKNKERIARLEADGRLEPAGIAAVEAAKRGGTWTALDDVEDLVEPDDLKAALDADPDARRHWDAFPPSTRRGILEWVLNAKRHETRTKRIAETASEASENRRANQWRQPKGR